MRDQNPLDQGNKVRLGLDLGLGLGLGLALDQGNKVTLTSYP